MAKCSMCNGTGEYGTGLNSKPCGKCRGTGVEAIPCPSCRGSGFIGVGINDKPCRKCNGTGRLN